MKKMFLILIVLFCSVTVNAKVNVIVSVAPQQTFVEKIGGGKVNVTTMVKPGSDPHTYEPKPSQMIALSKADIYYPIKIEFENAWLEKFKEQNNKMQFIPMTEDIEFIKMQAHGHSQNDTGLPFEWTGVFKLKKGDYTWSFAKVNGKYADPKMKFLMIKAQEHGSNLIEKYTDNAKEIFTSKNLITASNKDVIDTNMITYQLNFDEKKKQTTFKVSIKEDGNYLFFTEHMPFEFEDKEHFFKDIASNDIEPSQSSYPELVGHHHHHHDFDPHTWVSPANVKIMAKNIYESLSKIDSKNKSYYKNNYENFLNEIIATDKKIKKSLSKVPKGSKFMVFHPSWGYFAKDYGLVQLAIEVEGKKPKLKMLSKLIDTAKKENIKAIFTQQEFSDKSARAIAIELNIKVLKETPLAKNWSQNLLKMADAIANNY